MLPSSDLSQSNCCPRASESVGLLHSSIRVSRIAALEHPSQSDCCPRAPVRRVSPARPTGPDAAGDVRGPGGEGPGETPRGSPDGGRLAPIRAGWLRQLAPGGPGGVGVCGAPGRRPRRGCLTEKGGGVEGARGEGRERGEGDSQGPRRGGVSVSGVSLLRYASASSRLALRDSRSS